MVLRVGVRRGVDGVVVILGVGRIDGDERQRAPVLAARRVAGVAASASPPASRAERYAECRDAWMAIRLTARSLLSEPSRSFTRAGRQAIAAARGDLDRTRSPSAASGWRRVEWRVRGRVASCRPGPAGRRRPASAEDAEHALLGAIDQLDDAARMPDAFVLVAGGLDAQQRAVADAGRLRPAGRAAACECGFSADAPCASSSHSAERRSVRRRVSRSVMSARTTRKLPG